MVYYRIAWCIKKENRYCFGNWQPSSKILELENWVEKSNQKSDCYYWIEVKKNMMSEVYNYKKRKSSLSTIEKEYVSIEKFNKVI